MEERSAFKILTGKPTGKRPLGRANFLKLIKLKLTKRINQKGFLKYIFMVSILAHVHSFARGIHKKCMIYDNYSHIKLINPLAVTLKSSFNEQ